MAAKSQKFSFTSMLLGGGLVDLKFDLLAMRELAARLQGCANIIHAAIQTLQPFDVATVIFCIRPNKHHLYHKLLRIK